MDVSEREDQPSSDIEEDIECRKVSTRIASVTLESDSLPESTNNVAEERAVRRKKRVKRCIKGQGMDVDPPPKPKGESKHMECDGTESHISSSDNDSLSGDNRGGEADDEQSDWVGDTTPTGNGMPADLAPFDRRLFLRKSTPSHHMSNIQKKIERFSRDGGRGELVLDLRLRDRSTMSLLNRYMFKFHLEIIKRHRNSVTLKKKADAPSTSTAR